MFSCNGARLTPTHCRDTEPHTFWITLLGVAPAGQHSLPPIIKQAALTDWPCAAGLTPRGITELFNILDRDSGKYTFSVSCYMLELYQDDLQDLLLLVPKATHKVGCQCGVWPPRSESGAGLCQHLLQAVPRCKQRWSFLVLCQNNLQDLLQLVS